MKKGIWKKGLAFALAVVMTLGLGACGGKGGDDNGQLAKENVYSFQEIVPVSDQENVSGLPYRLSAITVSIPMVPTRILWSWFVRSGRRATAI